MLGKNLSLGEKANVHGELWCHLEILKFNAIPHAQWRHLEILKCNAIPHVQHYMYLLVLD